MKHLLDVNMLLAAIWGDHVHNATAKAWLADKSIVVCPIAELGFLRVSTHPRGIGVSMVDARLALERFVEERKANRIPDDLPALDSKPQTADQVTDHYLADLAAKHGLKLATFDTNIAHAAVELVR